MIAGHTVLVMGRNIDLFNNPKSMNTATYPACVQTYGYNHFASRLVHHCSYFDALPQTAGHVNMWAVR